jgi:hypothetical protein
MSKAPDVELLTYYASNIANQLAIKIAPEETVANSYDLFN